MHGFQGEAAKPLERWQQRHLLRSVEPVLKEPWICDIDVTSKTVYGRQQGAEVGYNPHKPGRPAHAYHTFFISRLRLVLDVVVAPGKQFHSRAVSPRFWPWWEPLSAAQRPRLLRGDCGFGNEHFMADCECPQHLQPYIFRLRQSRSGTQLIEPLSRQGGWKDCGQGWQAREQPLALPGWSRKRRVVVRRRRVPRPERELTDGSEALRLEVAASEPYEYALLVTNTDWDLVGLARLYRERADRENTIDELKRPWGWGGFVTQDLLRCQVAARNVALIYNWWSLFVRCAQPQRPREAVTSRPLLLAAVGRETSHAGQTTVVLTSTHGEGQASAAVMDRSEPLSERIAQYCEAVGPSGVLGTDLGANSDALSSSGGSQPRLVWAPAKIAGVAPANRSRETDAATGVWATRKASGVGFNCRF